MGEAAPAGQARLERRLKRAETVIEIKKLPRPGDPLKNLDSDVSD
jgi:hypothetical protein